MVRRDQQAYRDQSDDDSARQHDAQHAGAFLQRRRVSLSFGRTIAFCSRKFFGRFELGFALSLLGGQALVFGRAACRQVSAVSLVQIRCQVRPLVESLGGREPVHRVSQPGGALIRLRPLARGALHAIQHRQQRGIVGQPAFKKAPPPQ